MDTITTPVALSDHGGNPLADVGDGSDRELLSLIVATDAADTTAIETLFLRHLGFARRFVQNCGHLHEGLDVDAIITEAFGELCLSARAGNGPSGAVAPTIARNISRRLGFVPPEISSRTFLKLDDELRAALLVCSFTGGELCELVPAVAADERAASELVDRAIAQLRAGRDPAAALLRRRVAAGIVAVFLLGGAGGAWALSRSTDSIDVLVPAPPRGNFTAPARDARGPPHRLRPRERSATPQASCHRAREHRSHQVLPGEAALVSRRPPTPPSPVGPTPPQRRS